MTFDTTWYVPETAAARAAELHAETTRIPAGAGALMLAVAGIVPLLRAVTS